jgi:hypothetical protein
MNNHFYDSVDLEEFTVGCKATGCDDIPKWKAFVAGKATASMKDPAFMKKVYSYYFGPAKDATKSFIGLTEEACTYHWYACQFFTNNQNTGSIPKCDFWDKWIKFTYEQGAKNKVMT